MSERRACRVVEQHRSTQRYELQATDQTRLLVKRMHELSDAHPRYGYRRIWALLRAEGWRVNRKRVERLWRKEGLRVPAPVKRGQRAIGDADQAVWKLKAEHENHIWAYDFVSEKTRRGTTIKILNVVDEFTRQVVACHVDRSIGANRIVEVLVEAFRVHGVPGMIRSDNGREFIAQTVLEFLEGRGVTPAFIEKGRPQQNGFVERFNGVMRDELLNREVFHTLLEARVITREWVEAYNTRRPHSALGYQTPTQYAKELRYQNRKQHIGRNT